MATIHDVAKKAQVSISTVSRVLNGTTFVKSEVKKRVEAAMQELAYQPSTAARSLRSNQSHIIGLLISDILNPFVMSLIQGVEDEAFKHGYRVLLCNSNKDPQRELRYLKILCTERVAGAIIAPTICEHLEAGIDDCYKQNISIVTVDRRIKNKQIDAVLINNLPGAYEATIHLIRNGYQRIGAINDLQTITTGQEQLAGYRMALEENGIPYDSSLTRSGTFGRASGYKLAQELLALTPPINALFAGNSLIAMGALEAIHEKHLRIPEDIAFVGSDELPWTIPGLSQFTMVVQPVYELGRTAAQRLLQRLQKTLPQSRQEITLSSQLIIRDSSRPRIEAKAGV